MDSYHENQSETSKLFPPQYGDFVLISSDGTRFHIPSFLLAHASGFFRDLLALPTESGADNAKFFYMKEDSGEVELLLRHIDPNKAKPDISSQTIGKLLEAARFYRVISILHWFKDAISAGGTETRDGCRIGAFIRQEPMLVLGLAFQLGLSDCVRAAMGELINCHVDKWNDEVDVDIPCRLILYCKSLRDARFRQYNELIEKLADFEMSNSHRPKDTQRSICMTCSVERSKWIHQLTLTAITHPNWGAFEKVYEDVEECEECEMLWTTYKSKPFEKWCNRVRPEQFDLRLPSIPSWMWGQLIRNADIYSDIPS